MMLDAFACIFIFFSKGIKWFLWCSIHNLSHMNHVGKFIKLPYPGGEIASVTTYITEVGSKRSLCSTLVLTLKTGVVDMFAMKQTKVRLFVTIDAGCFISRVWLCIWCSHAHMFRMLSGFLCYTMKKDNPTRTCGWRLLGSPFYTWTIFRSREGLDPLLPCWILRHPRIYDVGRYHLQYRILIGSECQLWHWTIGWGEDERNSAWNIQCRVDGLAPKLSHLVWCLLINWVVATQLFLTSTRNLGKMNPFWVIFFKGVGSTTNLVN